MTILGRPEELVSWCVECDLAEPESLESLGGSAPGVVDGILSLPYDLVSLENREELPDGCARDAWERLTSEYDLTEGEDKITLLSMF